MIMEIKNHESNIRDAVKLDAEQIANIRINARKEWYKWIISQEYLDSLVNNNERIQNYKDIIESKKNIFLVSEKKWVINWFVLWWTGRDEDYNNIDEIYAFYVDPKAQREWIWSSLFENFCNRSNSNLIYLWTLPWSKWESFYIKKWWEMSWIKQIEIGWKKYEEARYFFYI